MNTLNCEITHRQGSRDYQQDRHLVMDLPHTDLFMAGVFDGMGGMAYGAQAAEIGMHAVASAFVEYAYAACPMRPEMIAMQCLLRAQQLVHAFDKEGMSGSTAIVAVLDAQSGHTGISWLGDSLAGLYVAGDIFKTITSPHTVAADSRWATVKHDEAEKGGLTRHLGEKQYYLEPQFTAGSISPKQRLFLMSDGGFTALHTAGFEKLAEQSAKNLIEGVDDTNLEDNTTVLEITYVPTGTSQ